MGIFIHKVIGMRCGREFPLNVLDVSDQFCPSCHVIFASGLVIDIYSTQLTGSSGSGDCVVVVVGGKS